MSAVLFLGAFGFISVPELEEVAMSYVKIIVSNTSNGVIL